MSDEWPAFDVERDAPTFALLHLASQMLGKLRVAHAPWANHGWHVTLAAGRRRAGDAADCGGRPTVRTDHRPLRARHCPSHQQGRPRHASAARISALPRFIGTSIAMLDRHGLPSDFQRPSQRSRRCHSVCRGRCTARLQSRFRRAAARRAGADRADLRAVSRGLRWQGQPGPFLLGQFRSWR